MIDKKYPQELKDFIQDHLCGNRRGIVNHIKFTHGVEYHNIIELTNFLPDNCKFVERMYCMINELYSRPKCVVCGNSVNWYKTKYLDHCSVTCINKNVNTRNKIKQTCMERYGVEVPIQSKKIHHKMKQTCIERYGVEYASQNRAITHKSQIKLRQLFEGNFKLGDVLGWFPNIGKNETRLLNEVEQTKKISIIRQYPVCGFVVDGYCEETNTVYEVDEKYHEKQIEKDIKRQRIITKHLGCEFIRIKDYIHTTI